MKHHQQNIFFLILNILYSILFLLLALGQIGRVQLTSTVAIYLHDISVICIIITFVIHLLINKPKLYFHSLFWWPTSFFIVGVISLALNHSLTISNSNGILYLLRWSSYATLLPITYQLIKTKAVTINITNSIFKTLTLIAIFGLIQYFFLPDIRFLFKLGWDDHLNRLVSTIFDPGFTGIVLLLGLIINQLKNKPNQFINALFYSTITLTYSRATFLTLVVSVFILSLYKKSPRLFFANMFVFLSLILLLPRTEGEGVKLERTTSIDARIQTTQQAVKQSTHNPIIGIGFNNYRAINQLPRLYPSHSGAPDNSLTFLFLTTGIIGTITYLYWVTRTLIWSHTHSHSIFIILIAILVHSLFNETLFYPFTSIIFWLLLADQLSLSQTLPIKPNKRSH